MTKDEWKDVAEMFAYALGIFFFAWVFIAVLMAFAPNT